MAMAFCPLVFALLPKAMESFALACTCAPTPNAKLFSAAVDTVAPLPNTTLSLLWALLPFPSTMLSVAAAVVSLPLPIIRLLLPASLLLLPNAPALLAVTVKLSFPTT